MSLKRILIITALLQTLICEGQFKGNFGIQPGVEVTLGYRKTSEIGFGFNLFASKLESSHPFLVHSFSAIALLNTNFKQTVLTLRFPYDVFLFQDSYDIMPSIGIFTEFNQRIQPDFGFRLGMVIGTTLHVHYTYTYFYKNEQSLFSAHGISITARLNELHISQMAWKNEPRFRNH